MRRRLLGLVGIVVLIVSILSGCACSKEAKISGTWEEKFDVEKIYGEPENEIDQKFLGRWESYGKTITLRADHTNDNGEKCWEVKEESGQPVLIYTFELDRDTSVGSKGEKFDAYLRYNKDDDYFQVEKLISKNNGQEITEECNSNDLQDGGNYKRFRKGAHYLREDTERGVKATYVLNDDNTGTYKENKKKAQTLETTWAFSNNKDENTIVITPVNDTKTKEMHLTYDPDTDTMKNEANEKYKLYRVKNSK